MPREIAEDLLHRPTKYRVEQGVMTSNPEEQIPTMSFTWDKYPPVFLRDGVLYDQGGREFKEDELPGGKEAFHAHVQSTTDPSALEAHGYVVEGTPVAVVKERKSKVVEVPTEKPEPHPNLKNLEPKDMSGDKQAVLDALGDRGMDKNSILQITELPMGRVNMALHELGDKVTRMGEGRSNSPFLYSRSQSI